MWYFQKILMGNTQLPSCYKSGQHIQNNQLKYTLMLIWLLREMFISIFIKDSNLLSNLKVWNRDRNSMLILPLYANFLQEDTGVEIENRWYPEEGEFITPYDLLTARNKGQYQQYNYWSWEVKLQILRCYAVSQGQMRINISKSHPLSH